MSSSSSHASRLMLDFAARSGLISDHREQRYLWTDAFAVCTFIGLGRTTSEPRYRELALSLIDRVHHSLGRHRADDPRSGWLSGLGEQQGADHPTRGGLRIGKPLPERRASEPFDPELEWERDGQYFHYLTKWMHALDQTSRWTGETRFNLWARELAQAAYDGFTYRTATSGPRRMAWKMSIDLSRPLIQSMGQHDPLDGFITCAELQATAAESSDKSGGPDLEREALGFAAMIDTSGLSTVDPLGLGGLLLDACRVAQLRGRSALVRDELLYTLLESALSGLRRYARREELRQPAEMRLPFRELGLSLGLHAVELIPQYWAGNSNIRAVLEPLRPFLALGPAIESFWMRGDNQQATTWRAHRDINEVMLAASLVPEGCLMLTAEHPTQLDNAPRS